MVSSNHIKTNPIKSFSQRFFNMVYAILIAVGDYKDIGAADIPTYKMRASEFRGKTSVWLPEMIIAEK